ncbi:ufm1-specific protease-like [Raphidocelis subcapitata]|uniref:Ufm1-specific protease-like n=1 Tax=Raphidocelis subcapitata TaxID=307507 RepID=A0A2V0P0F9_9CHLO|nr:ufm1-specific protease-like [Raphidocelis subcapitata]|eukprot:GBF93356.1 ufm1-specific protease-like [Raphidocelis subcapitata]
MAPSPAWRLRVAEGLAGALPAQAGLLLGAVDEAARAVSLLGAVPAPPDAGAADVAALAAKLLPLLPQGVEAVGSYGCAPPPAAPGGCPPVGCAAPPSPARAAATFTLGGEAAEAETAAVGPGLAPPGFTAVRCHCDLLLRVVSPQAGPSADALARAFAEVSQQLSGPGVAFASDASPGAPRVLITPATEGSLESALSACSGGGGPCASVSPLVAASSGAGRPAAPGFEFSPAEAGSTVTEVPLGLDVLALAPSSLPASALAARCLVPAIARQLAEAERQLAARLTGGGGGGGGALAPARALHFRPPGWALPLTAVYPRLAADGDAAEAALLPARQALHALLGLPHDVPMLRAGNALAWGGGGGGGGDEGRGGAGRLRDVHASLAAPAVGGSPSLIRGSYEYYHYMQDRFNDSGWGCAYRSLQTIVSWFRLQRYTDKPVPSHREIQSLLVKLGDKDPSFIGSSNWIGAIELSYVLSEYLGILTVNRGADIPSRARELAAHFEAQGTPVMIGGGVLAYTLLGVQFDELTGDAAFLILDPHYTGGEDLRKIQQGTWVAWKQPGDSAAAGGPLYVDDTFYNFLLPQRPSTV